MDSTYDIDKHYLDLGSHIQVGFEDSMTAADMQEIGVRVSKASQEYARNGIPFNFLGDATESTQPNVEVFRSALSTFQDINFNKIAILVSAKSTTMILINTMMDAFASDKNIKLFKEKPEALRWLTNHS